MEKPRETGKLARILNTCFMYIVDGWWGVGEMENREAMAGSRDGRGMFIISEATRVLVGMETERGHEQRGCLRAGRDGGRGRVRWRRGWWSGR